jgi:hypothetical protein
MADTEREIFASAFSDEPPPADGGNEPTPETKEAAPAPSEAPPAATDGQPRDEQGRFAPKAVEGTQDAPQPAPAVAAEADKGQPPPGLLEERRKRQDAEARLEALSRQVEALSARVPQPQAAEPPPAPVLWDDPDQYIQHHLSPLAQRMQAQQEFISEALAAQAHGQETVEAAKAALNDLRSRDPKAAAGIARALMQERHPYDALVQWHKRETAVAEIGTDPAAYREKLKAEILAELQAGGAPAATGARPPAIDLPSLNGASGRGNAAAPPMDDRALFHDAIRR